METISIAGLLRRRHHDHGGNPAERRERQSFDHLLIGDDVIGSRRQQAVDTPDPKRMLKRDGFTPRAHGHATTVVVSGSRPALLLCMDSPCALLGRIAIAFSLDWRYRPNRRALPNRRACLVFGRVGSHLGSIFGHFPANGRQNPSKRPGRGLHLRIQLLFNGRFRSLTSRLQDEGQRAILLVQAIRCFA